MHYFATIGSTMTEAAKLGERMLPHGTIVLAEEQSAVGRLGRTWHSPTGSGIYTSILLRFKLPPASHPRRQPASWSRRCRRHSENHQFTLRPTLA